jgi:hypothetical protein
VRGFRSRSPPTAKTAAAAILKNRRRLHESANVLSDDSRGIASRAQSTACDLYGYNRGGTARAFRVGGADRSRKQAI